MQVITGSFECAANPHSTRERSEPQAWGCATQAQASPGNYDEPMPRSASPPDAMIHTADLRVDYDDFTAVHALDLDIHAGEVYGLIGPNGAGKTSTIKVLATLLEPTYGDVFIAGCDVAVDPAGARAALGYMPDLAPVYDDLKVWEFLDVFARAHGCLLYTSPSPRD